MANTLDNTAQNNPMFRKFSSVLGCLALCAAALGAVVPAFMDPGPPAPVGRALNMAATENGRQAYVEAMKAQGYEILPPVQFSQVK